MFRIDGEGDQADVGVRRRTRPASRAIVAVTWGQGPVQCVKMNDAIQTLPRRSAARTVRPSWSVRVKSPTG